MAIPGQITDNNTLPCEALILQTESLSELCSITYTTDNQQYKVLMEAATHEVSLEGLNKFLITVSDETYDSDLSPEKNLATPSINAQEQKQKLRAELTINLRQEMNNISIAGDHPLYFTITARSLVLGNLNIDSSIVEVVDLGLINLQIKQGIKPARQTENQSILFNAMVSNLLKASISALLAQVTNCHKQVIQNADHLFANRQDYIRDMCRCITQNANILSLNVTEKARQCEHNLF